MGLIAALAWGVHDLCVRSVSRRADTAACLLGVFSLGLLMMLPVLLWQAFGGSGAMPGASVDAGTPVAGGGLRITGSALASGLAIGVLYAAANYTLYRAFASGPVRIVAPVSASYPVYTVALAVAGGVTVALASWIAVLTVIAGIALVAFTSDPDEPAFRPRAVFGWSLLASIGYALSFALGQHLSGDGDTVVTLVLTRAFALLTVLLFMLAGGGLRLPPRDTWGPIALMAAMDVIALGLVFGAGGLPDAAFATVTASMFGIVTIVLARLVFGELLSLRQWGGVAVAFGAIGWLASH